MRKERRLNFQRLETRKLLAADLGFDVMQTCDVEPAPETCMIAPEVAEDTQGVLIEDDLFVDPIAGEDSTTESTSGEESGPLVEPGSQLRPEFKLDLADGMDGYFGELDADNPSDTLAFVANSDGMVDVVVASSFGDATTSLEVHDESGELIATSDTEGLDGFQSLSFAGKSDQMYMLTVSSEDGGTGRFQVTIGSEIQSEVDCEETDLEIDEVGEVDESVVDSTESDSNDELEPGTGGEESIADGIIYDETVAEEVVDGETDAEDIALDLKKKSLEKLWMTQAMS